MFHSFMSLVLSWEYPCSKQFGLHYSEVYAPESFYLESCMLGNLIDPAISNLLVSLSPAWSFGDYHLLGLLLFVCEGHKIETMFLETFGFQLQNTLTS